MNRTDQPAFLVPVLAPAVRSVQSDDGADVAYVFFDEFARPTVAGFRAYMSGLGFQETPRVGFPYWYTSAQGVECFVLEDETATDSEAAPILAAYIFAGDEGVEAPALVGGLVIALVIAILQAWPTAEWDVDTVFLAAMLVHAPGRRAGQFPRGEAKIVKAA